jgi:hypothetical protein
MKAIHSVNGGEYDGESIIFWAKSNQSQAYYYFPIAGFIPTALCNIIGIMTS